MRYATKLLFLIPVSLSIASCASFDEGNNASGDLASASAPKSLQTPNLGGSVSDFPVKIGEAYKIGNKSYTPADTPDYDEVGYASYYGAEMAGNQTANGEAFIPTAFTAAHKTLPLPSYVEVTSLDTGRTILVRINDRGPFANDRLIDLSEGAARQLGITGQGITGQGVAGVRVRRVNPPEQERTILRSGMSAAERISTPDGLLNILRAKLKALPQPAAPVRTARAVTPSNAGLSSVPLQGGIDAGAPYEGGDSSDGRFVREGSAPGATRQANTSRPPRGATPTSPPPTQPQKSLDEFIREGGSASPTYEESAPTQRQNTRTAQARAVQPVQPAQAAQPEYAAGGTYVIQVAAFSDKERAIDFARKIRAAVDFTGTAYRVRYGPFNSEAEAQSGLATVQKRGYREARIFRQ